ncbi:MAG: hypothetical protein KA198_06290 [Chitinophagaceae bacterium]|nr:hypothetical protein [Chitinophagaceae bacterium]
MKKEFLLIVSICCSFIFIVSCKKEKEDKDNNAGIISCSLPLQGLAHGDSIYTIYQDTSYISSNQTFYNEHIVSAGFGVGIDMNKNILGGKNGEYEITSAFNQIILTENKSYITFYYNGSSYIAQSGKLLISQSESKPIIEFCKVQFKDSFGTIYQVSLKTYLN